MNFRPRMEGITFSPGARPKVAPPEGLSSVPNLTDTEHGAETIAHIETEVTQEQNRFVTKHLDYIAEARKFLAEGAEHALDPQTIERIAMETARTEQGIVEYVGRDTHEHRPVVLYNRHKKEFIADGKPVTAGRILASRYFGTDPVLPASMEQGSGAEKRLRSGYIQMKMRDGLNQKLNGALAASLGELTRRKDMMKSDAYKSIALREQSLEENLQLGVFAEKMMIATAEMFAIDKSHLNLEILPANAFQDVEQKIDFVIRIKDRKRMVGTELKEPVADPDGVTRTYGIQFTINDEKLAFKEKQLGVAKGKTDNIQDILSVFIDKKTMFDAKTKWEAARKPLGGPWDFLPAPARIRTLEALFRGIISDEELTGLKNEQK